MFPVYAMVGRTWLGCLTGVDRTAAEAAQLLDGKYCLTGQGHMEISSFGQTCRTWAVLYTSSIFYGLPGMYVYKYLNLDID